MNRPLIVPVLFVLSACAAPASDYPSLLPRPIEKLGLGEPVRPVAVATPDAVLDARIAGLQTALRKAQATFDAAVAKARPAIARARGAAEGSDTWLGAQVALAQLDVARTDIDTPVADLERLAIDRAATGQPPYPMLDKAAADATAAAAAQRATIVTLGASLRGG
jgi:hypothetical protein